MEETVVEELPGYQSVVDHFGRWPSFHDAHILQLKLDHNGASVLSIHTWNMTSELDERGYYRLTHHGVVHFTLTGISDIELFEFNVGSIIFGLRIGVVAEEVEIVLHPCLGLSGKLRCQTVVLSVEPYSQA